MSLPLCLCKRSDLLRDGVSQTIYRDYCKLFTEHMLGVQRTGKNREENQTRFNLGRNAESVW